jgi:hypothetical protein
VRLMADAIAGAAAVDGEQAALHARVDLVHADQAYRAGSALRGWWRRAFAALERR